MDSDDNRMVIGGWLNDELARNAGGIYIYERSSKGWDLTQKLLRPDGGDGDGFGKPVLLYGNMLVVGIVGERVTEVYEYFDRTWERSASLVGHDAQSLDQYGNAVALDGETLVAGACGADAAYVFERDDAGQWQETAKLIPWDIQLEPPDVDCNANGTPDECESDCNLNGIPDECDLDPSDPDGDGLVSPDSNANGIPDECESDCNLNGIPDECDLDPTDPDGDGLVSPDCNANETPDECDLDPSDPDGDYLVSRDVNNNQTPDECEPLATLPRVDTEPTGGVDLADFERNVTHYTFDLLVDTRLRAADWLRCELSADVFGDMDGDATIDGSFWHASDESNFGPPLGNLMVPFLDGASSDTRAFDTFVSVPGFDFFQPALLDAPGGIVSTDVQIAGRDAAGGVIPLRWYDVVSRPAGERFAALRVTVAVDPARVHGLIAVDDNAAAGGEPPAGSVAFASLTGAAVHTAGPAQPFAFTLYATPAACPADLNGDRVIDLADLNLLLLLHFGQRDLPADPNCPGDSPTRCAGDLDADRDVDLLDLSAMLIVFGSECE